MPTTAMIAAVSIITGYQCKFFASKSNSIKLCFVFIISVSYTIYMHTYVYRSITTMHVS